MKKLEACYPVITNMKIRILNYMTQKVSFHATECSTLKCNLIKTQEQALYLYLF